MNKVEQSIINNKTNQVIYCHFNFKRPKGEEFGYFAVAFYTDFEGKKLVYHVTRQFPLWENQQFISAIQAYEHALGTIYDMQGVLKKRGVSKVMLVTDNSTLAGWIQNHKKNKNYTEYMNRAVEKYKIGGIKELAIGIGLCEVRDYEKSYKYCKKELVVNTNTEVVKKVDTGANVIDIENTGMTYKTITQLEETNPNKPEIVGM